MKKSLKMMALGLAIIPSALVLTACGGGEGALVDTSGNYTAIKTSEYQNTITDLENRGFDIQSMLSGLHLSLELDATMTINDEQSTITVTSDSYIKNSSQDGYLDINQLEALSSLSMDMNMRSNGVESNLSGTLNQYILEGNQYADFSQAEAIMALINMATGITAPSKFYQTLATGTAEDVIELPDISLSTLVQAIPAGSFGTDIVLEKYENEGDYKIRITADGAFIEDLIADNLANSEAGVDMTIELEDDIVIYIVYSNDNFVGANITASVNMSTMMSVGEGQLLQLSITGSIEANILPFADEINFPTDLASYEELDSEKSVAFERSGM